jgi:pimeloyl-ACP methyl ester carboxylesterase
MSAQAFFREAGQGTALVCLHSNASSSSQWRPLMDLLAPRFRVIAADSYGAGRSPPWPAGRAVTLHDEVALLEPAFARAGDSFILAGHSYGGAVALIAALAYRKRLRALVLYEPSLFALIDRISPPPNDADGIKGAVQRAVAALAEGDEDAAARHFIDFWMGEGAWAATAEARKPAIAAAVRNVQGWADALMLEKTPLEAFAALDVPVLYLKGSKSPASAHGVARVLAPVLPRVELVELDGVGHMAPITHPDVVNRVIAGFLDRLG